MNGCFNCKYWQGNKYSKSSDCYRVVASLEPKLLHYKRKSIYKEDLEFFSVPFDPNDIKYWIWTRGFIEMYKKTISNIKENGIKVVEKKMKDKSLYLREDIRGVSFANLYYIQTNRDYICNQWRKLNEKHRSFE